MLISKRSHGTTKSDRIELGAWTGKTNLIAIPMDDFQVILGIEFLQDNNDTHIPYLDSLCMFGETLCMIPIVSKRDSKKLISNF